MIDKKCGLEKEADNRLFKDATLYQDAIDHFEQRAKKNLEWLYTNVHPYFFITMREEIDAIVNLAGTFHLLEEHRKLTLLDHDKKLILARLDIPGSLYDTLKTLQEREISYAEITHSYAPIPNVGHELEVQRFEFDRVSNEEIVQFGTVKLPRNIRRDVIEAMQIFYPDFGVKSFNKALELLWINNPCYVRISPSERIARVLWLYIEAQRRGGFYLDVEKTHHLSKYKESRLLFSVENPKQRGFLTQVSEVFQRLNVGVHRFYSLIINTGFAPFFLGTFYVATHDGTWLERDTPLYRKIKRELYNTQILSTQEPTYSQFVTTDIMTGEEASLVNAFIAFCHTTLARPFSVTKMSKKALVKPYCNLWSR